MSVENRPQIQARTGYNSFEKAISSDVSAGGSATASSFFPTTSFEFATQTTRRMLEDSLVLLTIFYNDLGEWLITFLGSQEVANAGTELYEQECDHDR